MAEQIRSLEANRARLTDELARREAAVQQLEADALEEAKRREAALSRSLSQLDQVTAPLPCALQASNPPNNLEVPSLVSEMPHSCSPGHAHGMMPMLIRPESPSTALDCILLPLDSICDST